MGKPRGQVGSVSYSEVASRLRRRIVAGALAPGDRLPTNVELRRAFGTTPVTVQRALDRLAEEGFIRTVPTVGKYVADYPPHACRWGIVFPGHPEHVRSFLWTRHYMALWAVARPMRGAGPRQIRPYFDVDPARDGQGYRQLADDVAARRLAGLVFAYTPHRLRSAPLLARPKLPMVFPGPLTGRETVVRTLNETVMARALDWLVAQGRRRVACVTQTGRSPHELRDAVGDRPIVSLPAWTQAVDLFHPDEWIRHVLETILCADPAGPPDALVVTDDHLVGPTARALAALGVRVPDDLLVVGHWNFPLRYDGPVPVKRVGFDARLWLGVCLRRLEQLRRGEPVPRLTPLTAVLDDEVEPDEIQVDWPALAEARPVEMEESRL